MKKHATPSRALLSLTALLVIALLLAACGGSTPTPAPTAAPTPTTAPPPTAAPEVKPTEAPKVDLSSLVFFSTQFAPVEEQEKFRAILKEGGFDFTSSEEGPLLDMVTAGAQTGKGTVDLVGALHGSFPPLQKVNAMANLADLARTSRPAAALPRPSWKPACWLPRTICTTCRGCRPPMSWPRTRTPSSTCRPARTSTP